MTFIPKEIPSGTIDGVNTTFTLLNAPETIEDIYIDGAIYTSFTYTNTIITLSDAPTASIFVDYNTSSTSSDAIDTTVNLGDVKTKIWRLLGQKSTSTNFSSETLNEEINTLLEEVWRGRVVNVLTQRLIEAGDMFFMHAYHSFRINDNATLSAPVIVGATNISLNAAGLNSTGYMMLGGDYIQYTGKTDTEITGVTGVTTTHSSGDKAIQMYELPTNYDILMEMDKVIYSNSGVDYSPIDMNHGRVSFEIIRLDSLPLMKINGLCKDDIVRTKYNIVYEDMNSDGESFKLPNKYGLTVVAYLVAGQLAYDKLLLNADRLLNKGYASLRQMYAYFANETKDLNQKIRPTPYRNIGKTRR